MTFLKAFAGTIVSFLVIDAVWIGAVVRKLYREEVGGLLKDAPDMGAAAVFYVAYAAGIVWLAVLPALGAGSARTALVNGAVLGALAYGTYTVTNYAVLRSWTFTLVWSDIVWGAFLTAVCAACGYFAARLGG